MTQVITPVKDRITEVAQQLRDLAPATDATGSLPPEVADLVRSTGVTRMLLARELGGYESDLDEFCEAVINIAALNPSAGWVAGVVGVHPWELSQVDPKLQQEIWGEDPDVWTASPYMPAGRATRVDGGFRLSGRWSFSSGTDACDWVTIGGVVVDGEGKPEPGPNWYHFVLPRPDYEIIEDSWNVVGLKGTGSKDLLVEDVFVPAYRVIDNEDLDQGRMTEQYAPGKPLYHLSFGTVFSYAITSATLGICVGAINEFVEYTRDKVGGFGGRAAANPFQQAAHAEAVAEIEASQLQLLDGARRMMDIVNSGRKMTRSERLYFRTIQVRSARRAVNAIEKLYTYAGGSAIRLEQPIQRYWRDAHAAANHMCNIAESIYTNYALDVYGLDHDQKLFY